MPRDSLANVQLSDWTGGLNLGPPQEGGLNEVAFIRDMDISEAGGINSRKGLVPFTVENPGDDIYLLQGFHEVREIENVFGANVSRWQVFAPRQDNDEWQMYWTDGGQWHVMRETNSFDIVTTQLGNASPSEPLIPQFAQFGDRSYFVHGLPNGFYYDNGSIVQLTDSNGGFNASGSMIWNGYRAFFPGGAWDDDFASVSTQINFPAATLVAAHKFFVFVADTYEAGDDGFVQSGRTRYSNRIRWCHPSNPHRWRQQDSIDVPRGTIRWIGSHRDYLVIITDNEVFGLYGDDADSFALQQISSASGTNYHTSVAASPTSLYWWDWAEGVMQLRGTTPKSIFRQLKPLLRTGELSLNDPPEMLWANGRLYVHFRNYGGDLGSTFIWDERLGGGEGAWFTYEMGNVRGLSRMPSRTSEDIALFGRAQRLFVANTTRHALDRTLTWDSEDKIAPDAKVTFFPFEGESNVTKKRWRRPRATIRSGSSKQRIMFRYAKNYDETVREPDRIIDLDFTATMDADTGFWADELGFIDPFTSNRTDIWTGFSAGDCETASGDLVLSPAIGTGVETLTTLSAYDITGIGAVIQIDTFPTASESAWLLFNSNRYLRFYYTQSSNLLRWAWRSQAGVETVLGTATFDINLHRYTRIREEDGTYYFDRSGDGETWVNLTALPNPFGGTFNFSLQIRAEDTASQTTEFEMAYLGDLDSLWDQAEWAAVDPAVAPPNNFIKFETLPSAGSGNVFQMEFAAVPVSLQDQSAIDATEYTNDSWGIDSLVLPYRDKGIR